MVITYDRPGRTSAIGNGIANSVFTYDPVNLLTDNQTVSYDLNGDSTIDFTRVLDRGRDTYLRDNGWQLKDGSTVENDVEYRYDSAGRFGEIEGPSGTFVYGYHANSHGLLETVTGPAHIVTNTWETNRDVLDIKENKVGTTTVSSYDYVVNGIGQRVGVEQSGTAFGSARDIVWGYDSLGQIITADSSVSTSDRAYQYDAIGNRKISADSLTLPGSDNYTSNALNQYTSIQQGDMGVSPGYDDDGNATAYPLPVAPTTNSTVVWDAENRMTATTVGTTTTTYLYDAYSRRIAKTTGTNTTVFLYDVWNLVAEHSYSALATPHSALLRSHLWGTDLSGSLQGAGGVGGLLLVTDHSEPGASPYYPTYDANGNVSEYVDAIGTLAAHFEYDPFGRTVVDTDTQGVFDIRFSTEKLDLETGLYYYGYRYYEPLKGRWLSRDPIQESGGINLTGFLGNNPVDWVDILGLHQGDKWYGHNNRDFQRWVHNKKQDENRRNDYDKDELDELKEEWEEECEEKKKKDKEKEKEKEENEKKKEEEEAAAEKAKAEAERNARIEAAMDAAIDREIEKAKGAIVLGIGAAILEGLSAARAGWFAAGATQ